MLLVHSCRRHSPNPLNPIEYDVSGLPIEAHLSDIEQALVAGNLVITAEPGAGKSSLVPIATANSLLAIGKSSKKGNNRILMLEPRRLAAQATANRIAQLTRSPLGKIAGYSIRGKRILERSARIEVITEALLTRRIQNDPELPGVATIIFDEFHERNLHSDLGLAFALETQATIRPDLRIVVMSATINSARVAQLLTKPDGPPPTVIEAEGRTFPVETRHGFRPGRRNWAEAVAHGVGELRREVNGDVLVFAPGRWEVSKAAEKIRATSGGLVFELHGGTKPQDHQHLFQKADKQRIIVATAVAETSITLPGIEAVVDGGLMRHPRFDPKTGLGKLETSFVTKFAADQRTGRAGRLKPGICLRLWSKEDERHLDQEAKPEISVGDPIPLSFELMVWGDQDGQDLAFLDPPSKSRLKAARDLLAGMKLVEDKRLTAAGKKAAKLPLHPRTSAAVLSAERLNQGALGVRLAAAIDDNNQASQAVDLRTEVDKVSSNHPLIRRLEKTVKAHGHFDSAEIGCLLAKAWPDRIAALRPNQNGKYLLSSGTEAKLAPNNSLSDHEFLVIVEASGSTDSLRIRSAVPIERAELAKLEELFIKEDQVRWNEQTDEVEAIRLRKLGAIPWHQEALKKPSPKLVEQALLKGLRSTSLDRLSWSRKSLELKARVEWLRSFDADSWPDWTDGSLKSKLESWLPINGCKTMAQVRNINLARVLADQLDWSQKQKLQELAPTSWPTPNNDPAPISYQSGKPIWSVRIQHLFGLDQHPTIGPNRQPLTIELLSPANRPAQVTTDLPGFWRGSYAEVRADLRGRYRKHKWPTNPHETD